MGRDFWTVGNLLKTTPSHFAPRPLRGVGLAISGHNSPCLCMSELHPKTAKPPLVRHDFRTRVRLDFGTEEIALPLETNMELKTALIWFRPCEVAAREPLMYRGDR